MNFIGFFPLFIFPLHDIMFDSLAVQSCQSINGIMFFSLFSFSLFHERNPSTNQSNPKIDNSRIKLSRRYKWKTFFRLLWLRGKKEIIFIQIRVLTATSGRVVWGCEFVFVFVCQENNSIEKRAVFILHLKLLRLIA